VDFSKRFLMPFRRRPHRFNETLGDFPACLAIANLLYIWWIFLLQNRGSNKTKLQNPFRSSVVVVDGAAWSQIKLNPCSFHCRRSSNIRDTLEPSSRGRGGLSKMARTSQARGPAITSFTVAAQSKYSSVLQCSSFRQRNTEYSFVLQIRAFSS
jgi:hypothetical protein